MRTSRFIAAIIAISTVAMVAPAGGVTPGLPLHARTPGALNPAVRSTTIHATICRSGYSASVRPSSSYTESLKFHQLDGGYNVNGDTYASNYEEDHLVPLEVGGSPTSVKNLWPEPRNVYWGAAKKDRLENVMHRLVCSGKVSLASAQRMFEVNWIVGYQRYIGG